MTSLAHGSKHRLLRHYKRMFPPARGLYLDGATERWMRREEARDRARALIAAVDNLGNTIDAAELAETVNAVAPGDDWMVAPQPRFDELRGHYDVLYRLVDELVQLVRNGGIDAPGRMVELVRDALRYGGWLEQSRRSPPESFE